MYIFRVGTEIAFPAVSIIQNIHETQEASKNASEQPE